MLRVLVLLLGLVQLVNRYLGAVVRLSRPGPDDEPLAADLPTVTVVIPLYNEGAAIQDTLRSVLASDYPRERLRVVCVDDASTDASHALAAAVAREDDRLTVRRNPRNLGKRTSINQVVRDSDSELIVSVDSDVVIEPAAIRALVARFTSPRVAAVGGWVDVRNKHDNWLTRMQVLKYWYAYYVARNIERSFRLVMSVSACLAAYRRSVLVELLPVLEDRALLGVPIKYGEDRFLTRQIIKAGYLTTTTLDARCRTFVPATLMDYFAQQLRWRRANIIDYLGGCSHVWRLPPLVAIGYFAAMLVLFMYPLGLYRALVAGRLLHVLIAHGGFLTIYGVYYRWRVRGWPPAERVGALSYLPHALCMPISNGLLLPVALFTLDSSAWETRAPAQPAEPGG